jgi:hypothetical protein
MSEGASFLHKLRRGEIYFDSTLLYSTLLYSTLFMKWESIGDNRKVISRWLLILLNIYKKQNFPCIQ